MISGDISRPAQQPHPGIYQISAHYKTCTQLRLRAQDVQVIQISCLVTMRLAFHETMKKGGGSVRQGFKLL